MIIITAKKKINIKNTIITIIRKIITVKIINLIVLTSKKIRTDVKEIEGETATTTNEYMGTPTHIFQTGLLNTKKDNLKIITISVHPSTTTTQYKGRETQIKEEKETEKEKASTLEEKIRETETESETKQKNLKIMENI